MNTENGFVVYRGAYYLKEYSNGESILWPINDKNVFIIKSSIKGKTVVDYILNKKECNV